MTARRPGASTERARTRAAIVSGTSSDSHMWNLVYLELLLRELDFEVINLGACVPDQVLVDVCLDHPADLVVVGTVNGHGHNDGLRLIQKVRDRPALACTKLVIGGKLGVDDRGAAARRDSLLGAGFDGVFEGDAAIDSFLVFVNGLTSKMTDTAGALR